MRLEDNTILILILYCELSIQSDFDKSRVKLVRLWSAPDKANKHMTALGSCVSAASEWDHS